MTSAMPTGANSASSDSGRNSSLCALNRADHRRAGRNRHGAHASKFVAKHTSSENPRAEGLPGANPRSGAEFPYGLGWFVQMHQGTKVVWHFGQGLESSALLLKIPERQLTFVVLANSDALSRGLQLGDYGDVLRSPFAKLFLNWVARRS
jgi:CubicO group peptidase (beta-lactamase class C family)